MDDGFQHRKVKRDLDILTVSANERVKNYRLLPWGNLREPLKNIQRADVIIYTKTDNYKLPNIHSAIQPFIKSKHVISSLKPVLFKYKSSDYIKTLQPEEPMFSFCGIADSRSFTKSVEELSLHIKGSRFFKDHQDYTDSVIVELSEQIRLNGISHVVTTEKDMVKLPDSFLSEFIIYIIKISIKFKNDVEIQNLIKPLSLN